MTATNETRLQAKIDAAASSGRKYSWHCLKCGEEVSPEHPAAPDPRSGIRIDCPNCGASDWGMVLHELNAWLKTLPPNTRFVYNDGAISEDQTPP